MALTVPGHLLLRPPALLQKRIFVQVSVTRKANSLLFSSSYRNGIKPTRACNDGGGEVYVNPQQSDIDVTKDSENSASNTSDGYIPLFIRMLGLDYDPLDREQAVIALWKYSLGGKQCIDMIMKFRGSLNLTVNLLQSEADAACEAAAGLLRMISSVNVYRDLVADSGAVEEISSLLRRPSLPSNVKEQSLCLLWNLSVDEKLRKKIANSDLLPLLIKFLEDEEMEVKEAAGGVLANLALNSSNHKNMVEAGVIPKLATLLKTDAKGSKVIKKEARNALLELAKDEYNKILIMEEGLLLVPLVGASAYKSFRPALYSWPSLPDGTKIDQNPKPSRYGASELLLGLNIEDKNADIEEAKMDAMVGRTQQQFLARIGAIESEGENMSSEHSSEQRFTLLPWIDGVARLVLILGLEDELAIARAAEAIADVSINEHMRVSFKEAGALNHLVQLINHPSDTVKLAVIRALQRLSISNDVCQMMEAENVIHPLVYLLRNSEIPLSLTEMILDILTRILDPSKEMKSKFYNGPVNGSTKSWSVTRNTGLVGNENGEAASTTSSGTAANVVNLLDTTILSRLVDIMKMSCPDLQRKAASILEFTSVIEPCTEKLLSVDLEAGLDAVFRQKTLNDRDSELDLENPELHALELEEAGLAISAASRLLTRLLDFEQFRQKVNASHFTQLLRKVLKSEVPLHHKDWVAACLVKLSSLSGPNFNYDNPINLEVTLYETIPRLIEQINTSSSPEVQEAAVIELNRIISEEVVNSTRAVAAEGGIFSLVKLLENGTERAVEAALAILYNLSMDSENHAAIIAAGAVTSLRRLVLSQRSHWMRALRLLRTLPT